MSIVDIILLSLLVIGAVRGFNKGIILEIAGILGLFLALFGALQLVDWGVILIGGHAKVNESILPVLAFVLLFVAILVIVFIIGRMVKAAFHITPFGLIDNILGAGVGILKWALGISLLFWVFNVLGIEIAKVQLDKSIVFPYILLLAPLFLDFIAMVIPYFQALLSTMVSLFKHSTT